MRRAGRFSGFAAVEGSEVAPLVQRVRHLAREQGDLVTDAALQDSHIRLYVFWKAELTVRYSAGEPVALNFSKYGKRRRNLFEPYLNWHMAFTLPAHRRQGYVTELYRYVERQALGRGCRRIKALAGSAAGAGLHLALGHEFWGLRPTGELIVDSPLPGYEHLYEGKRAPESALTAEPMTPSKVADKMTGGLTYDWDRARRLANLQRRRTSAASSRP